jgi:hypothetical protein
MTIFLIKIKGVRNKIHFDGLKLFDTTKIFGSVFLIKVTLL